MFRRTSEKVCFMPDKSIIEKKIMSLICLMFSNLSTCSPGFVGDFSRHKFLGRSLASKATSVFYFWAHLEVDVVSHVDQFQCFCLYVFSFCFADRLLQHWDMNVNRFLG